MNKKHQNLRKKNNRGTPIVPAYLEAEDSVVVCPTCHAAFPLSALEPFDPCRESHARCPVCCAPCTADAYDREAAHMIELQREVEQLQAARGRALNEFDRKRIWHVPLVEKLLARVRQRRREQLKAELLEPISDISSRMVGLDKLASSRYLMSEYRLLTRTPLRIYAERGGYCMRCRYDMTGAFAFDYRHGYSMCRGLVGEIKAFEQVVAAMRAEARLEGARLVPNVFVRKNEGSNPSERGSYFSQLDMVLLTRRAAYVFEVKSRDASIEWGASGALEATYCQGDKVNVRKLAGDLQQLADHAFYFNRCVGRYPFDATFEVMVYVDPASCAADMEAFCDNLLVRSLTADARELVRIIAEQDARLSDAMDQNALDALAREVLARYGDRDLRKRQMHAMRLDRKTA